MTPATPHDLERALEEAKADALYWRLVADGTNHHPACERGFQGSTGWGLCMRCELEDMRAAGVPPPRHEA